MVIENRATLGAPFIKGMTAKVAEISSQADQAYSLGINSALGVENNTYTKLFKDKTSNNAQETMTSITGTGYLTLTPEGSNYAMDSRTSGYETQYKFFNYTNGIEITKLNRDDMIVEPKLDALRSLLVSVKMTMDKHAFDLFNYAFTAQASLPTHLTYYGDGVPFCSTLHPKKVAGSTQSNADANGLVLSHTNISTLRQQLRRQVDERGLPSNVGSGKLILLVPDALEELAVVTTKTTKRPNSANNDINIFDGNVTVISTKWINSQNGGSDTQFFLIDSMQSPCIFYNRQGIETDVWMDNRNKNLITDVSCRYQVGNKDFRGVVGSKGNASAYSS